MNEDLKGLPNMIGNLAAKLLTQALDSIVKSGMRESFGKIRELATQKRVQEAELIVRSIALDNLQLQEKHDQMM